MNWLKKLFKNDRNSADKQRNQFDHSKDEKGNLVVSTTKRHGMVENQHYTSCVDQVKELKRNGDHDSAIELLLKAVSATEKESREMGEDWGVAPWYYEQLAIIYRKEKRYGDEVGILKRYLSQSLAPGSGAEKLAARLVKAMELFNKHGQ